MGTLKTLRRSSRKAVGTPATGKPPAGREGTGSKRTTDGSARISAPDSLGPDAGPIVIGSSVRDLPRWEVTPARAGDHPSVRKLLASTLRRPSSVDFQSQLDDPYYEPNDRLLIKHGDQLLAHAHLTRRDMHFGSSVFPIVFANDFTTLPELRVHGIDNCLLDAVTAQVGHEGATLAAMRTTQPELFKSRDWFVCLRHSHSNASPREVLSQLQANKGPRYPSDDSAIAVRMWRHVEQAALVRLYAAYAAGSFGLLERSAAYWSWLISRREYDRLYVATRGPDTGALDDSSSPIVGYAVVRDHRILELVSSSDCPDAANELLARACRDAIEHDRHGMQLNAAPDDSLHAVFTASGGEQCYYEANHGEVWMVYLRDPMQFLRKIGDQIVKRAKRAGLTLPFELGLRVDSEKRALTIGPRRIKLTEGRLGRSYLECDTTLFSQLVLGHVDVRRAIHAGRLAVSTRVAADAAAAIFPQLPIWRPPWDEMSG